MQTNLQTEIATILTAKFAEARLRNPEYSQRAFARKLGISSGALTEVLKGQRGLSLAKAEAISERLALSPKEKEEFLASYFSLQTKRKAPAPQADVKLLPMDQFILISDALNYSVLSLIKTKNFRYDLAWMAKRLAATEAQVQEVVARLFRLGLVAEKDGTLKRTHNSLDTGDHFSSSAIRLAHEQNLRLAQKSLESQPTTVRDFTIHTFVADKNRLARLKKLVRAFQDLVEEEANVPEGTEVYRLSVQLFPMTVVEEDK